MWSKSVIANVFNSENSPFFAVAMVGNSNDTGNAELETFDSQILQAEIKLASLISRSLNSPTFWSQYVLQNLTWEGLVTRVRAHKISWLRQAQWAPHLWIKRKFVYLYIYIYIYLLGWAQRAPHLWWKRKIVYIYIYILYVRILYIYTRPHLCTMQYFHVACWSTAAQETRLAGQNGWTVGTNVTGTWKVRKGRHD